MSRTCTCGFTMCFCPCCGQRWSGTDICRKPAHPLTSECSVATAGGTAHAIVGEGAQGIAALTSVDTTPSVHALSVWRTVLPAKTVSAFDVFAAICVHTTRTTARLGGVVGTDAVLTAASEWAASQLPALTTEESFAGESASAVARAWLMAPADVRDGCRRVATWWSSHIAPSPAPLDPPLNGMADGPPRHCRTFLADSLDADDRAEHINAASHTHVGIKRKSAATAGTSAATVRMRPVGSAKRFPSSFELFRHAVKRKSLTKKAVSDLWATMTDGEKAPYDLQAANLRTRALLQAHQP